MAKKLELYRCELCGNLIEVVLEGEGELVCCGEPMELLDANKTDGAGEKHVPFFVKNEDNLEIRIGSELHPMEKEHYIQFIECVSRDEKGIRPSFVTPSTKRAISSPKVFFI